MKNKDSGVKITVNGELCEMTGPEDEVKKQLDRLYWTSQTWWDGMIKVQYIDVIPNYNRQVVNAKISSLGNNHRG